MACVFCVLISPPPPAPPIFFPFAPLSLFWLRSAVPEQAPHLATRTAKAVRENKLWPRNAAGFAGHENKHNLFKSINANPFAAGRLPLAVCGPSNKVAPVVGYIATHNAQYIATHIAQYIATHINRVATIRKTMCLPILLGQSFHKAR